MVKKFDWLDLIIVAGCLLFMIGISAYHVSYNGYLSLSNKDWKLVWVVSENFLSLWMCFIIGLFTGGIIKLVFKKILIPYFILKLIYHFSCYSGIYVFSVKTWELIWSFILVGLFVVGGVYSIYLIKRRMKHVA